MKRCSVLIEDKIPEVSIGLHEQPQLQHIQKNLLASKIVKLVGFYTKNPYGPELAKNGLQHGHQVAKNGLQHGHQVAKNDANLALSPRFRQVLIESPL
ncbi:hypothetical protein TNCV_4205561 [Trichonephila clavipes]|nr:hypothetical protein TNCV_4205561 [Trichonephila clavipes]